MIPICIKLFFCPLLQADISHGHDIAKRLSINPLIQRGTELDIKHLSFLGQSSGFKEADLLASEHFHNLSFGLWPIFWWHKIDFFTEQLFSGEIEGVLKGWIDIGCNTFHIVHYNRIR